MKISEHGKIGFIDEGCDMRNRVIDYGDNGPSPVKGNDICAVKTSQKETMQANF
jgi:hypothetical protein